MRSGQNVHGNPGRRRAWWLAAACVLVTACAATSEAEYRIVAIDHLFPPDGSGEEFLADPDGFGDGDGEDLDAPGPGSDDVTAGTQAGPSGPTGSSGATTGSTGAPGTAAGTTDPGSSTTGPSRSSTRGSSAATLGPGVTDEQILVGFETAVDVANTLSTFGYGDGEAPPDERQVVQAVVRWINQTGGIAGREVVPVMHETNPVSGTFASQAQAACATFTEDNQVFAVSTTAFGGTQHLPACLASRQTPVVANHFYTFTSRHYREWAGYLYQTSRMPAERGYTAMVDGLVEENFFAGAKVGAVALDGRDFRYLLDEVVEPRLARHGVTISERVYISQPESAGAVGRLSQEVNNAILRFRQAGVTHVLFVEFQGMVPFMFLPQAESQGYRPAYGISTYQAPVVTVKNSPSEQLRKLVGIGWSPFSDMKTPQYPDNPSIAACHRALRDAGMDLSYNAVGYYAHGHCDALLLLRAALADTTDLTARGFAAGVAGLGDSAVLPGALSTRFGPDRTGGAATWMSLRYDQGCDCARYSGRARPVR